MRPSSKRILISLALGAALCPAAAHADINGFGDFSNFTFNQSDSAAGPTVSTGTVHLSNNASGEVRSVFDDTPQNISHFTASFDFRAEGVPSNVSEFGACFIIQNDGVNQVATNNEGIQGTFGYQNWRTVFGQSVAVSLEYGSLGTNSSATALYSGGQLGGGSGATTPVNVFDGDQIDVTLTYNGSLLHENLLDTTSNASFDQYYVTSIPAAIGGPTAFVGFTANTANNSGAMDFSNLQFSNSVPEPSTACVIAAYLIGSLSIRRRHIVR